MLAHDQQQKIINALLKRKQNALCADCNSKSPCWASLNFGVFVCLNCSGAHRALGPSITRVKSARLDSWNRQWVECMQVGNSVLNQYWEHRLAETDRTTKPNSNSSLDAIIRYVQDKYVRKLYVDTHDNGDPLKRVKNGQTPPTQLSPSHELKIKSGKGTGRAQKPNTVIGLLGEQPYKPTAKSDPDFTVFDVMAKEKPKPVVAENLISFEQQKNKGIKKGISFDNFQFIAPVTKPAEEKYNKQQFMSMGGINPNKAKTQVSFQGFSKIQNNTHTQNHNNLIHFDHNPIHTQPNQTHFHDYGLPSNSNLPFHLQNQHTQHQQQHQQPHQQHQQQLYQQHYNKNQYATMGGGIHPAFRNQALLAANHNKNIGGPQLYQQQHQMKKNGQFIEGKNMGFGQGLGGHQSERKMGKQNAITLQANINFDQVGKEKKGPNAIKSWVDDWM